MAVDFDDNPKITDDVSFTFEVTDSDGNLVNPYKVNKVSILFIQRDHLIDKDKEISETIEDSTNTSYFRDADPVVSLGDDDFPAWLSTDTDNAFIEKLDFDDDDNPLIGTFRYIWTPEPAREGDYVFCYSWTVLAGGDIQYGSIQFFLAGDTSATTSIPTHFTPANKYETLLERYLPEMYKMTLCEGDLSPDVLDRTNQSIAKGFTFLEDLANQIVDLIDANVVRQSLLPYLSNHLGLRLRSPDITLWRRQIKEAVPLYKKKGTLIGLEEKLASAGITLNSFTQLWQIVSPSTWQEAFIVTDSEVFTLDKLAILDDPIDANNFELFIRFSGEDTYEELSLDYISFENIDGVTYATWVGDSLSVDPISLAEGDVVRIIYKVAEPEDQDIEDYIRTLSLADQRDELEVTYPVKNWNVRLIREDDSFFDVICPYRNPFYDDVIFGKIRTEFPYSENIYNMDTYNGSLRDSTDPCDIDKTFYDVCSCCLSSKFNVSIDIENLSSDRIEEASEIITSFVPFHSVLHEMDVVGSINEFMLSPVENIETLMTVRQQDTIIMTNLDFNRLIEDGSTDVGELKRNMLATSSVIYSGAGTGANIAVVLFSPPLQFDTMGIDTDDPNDNVLEILSGANAGEYAVAANPGDRFVIDVVQGSPDTISFPLDTSEFTFRLSNVVYEEAGASIYQDDKFVFSDENVVFSEFEIVSGWKIVVTSGPFAGVYTIETLNPDNTLTINDWASGDETGLFYDLKTDSDVTILSSITGQVIVENRGRVEIDLIAQELGIIQTDYVLYNGNQYEIVEVVERGVFDTTDKLYISDYTDGDVVGIANIKVYRRKVDNAIGFIDVRGFTLTGTIPTVDGTVEDNTFLENYLILINDDYYKITSIAGSTMYLSGPIFELGLTGTSVNYSIVHFEKTSPITTQTGVTFDRLDRRNPETVIIEVETSPMSMGVMSSFLNNDGFGDMIQSKEKVSIQIDYKE